jgi:hypothetical protein
LNCPENFHHSCSINTGIPTGQTCPIAKTTAALPAANQPQFKLILKQNLFRIPRIILLMPIILQASRREVGRPQYFKNSSRPRLLNGSVDNSRPSPTPSTSQSISILSVPLCTGPSTYCCRGLPVWAN